MLPWDDAQTYMRRLAQDDSAAALTFLKLAYNAGYKILLAEFGRDVIVKDRTIDLTAGTRGYRQGPDVQFPKTLELIDSTTINPLKEITDSKMWAYMKSGGIRGKPTHYHYLPRFGVGGGDIELDPIPSSSDYDLKVYFETTDKDLSQDAYTTGTVTLTANSTTVTGSGTTFTAAMVDRYLIPTTAGTSALPYRIASFTSTTVLALETAYLGSTSASLAYKIVEIPNLPQDMHVLPCYWSLEQWWSSKGNAAKTKEFQDKWVIGMARAKRTHATNSRDNLVSQDVPATPFPQYPFHYPQSVT